MEIKTKCCEESRPVGVIRPRFSWILQESQDPCQTAYEIWVYNSGHETVWYSGQVESSDSVRIDYNGGALESNTKYLWKVRIYTENHVYESMESSFITGILDEDPREWITADHTVNSPIFRKEFHLEQVEDYAVVNVCGLGMFELYVNGHKVSEDCMQPARTDYDNIQYADLQYPFSGTTRKRTFYVSYEISNYLRTGKNTVAVWLGNGWYRQYGRKTEGKFDYGDSLKLFVRLTCGNQRIMTDSTWQWIESPLQYDNIFYGEIFDGCRDWQGFVEGKETKESVRTAMPAIPPVGELISQILPPERIIDCVETCQMNKEVYDAGRCISGFVRVACNGTRGSRIEICYAEELDENMQLDYSSTVGYEEGDREQIQKDIYYLEGEKEEIYVPRFVWHAFRYVHIRLFGEVRIMSVKACFVCTDMQQRGRFNCSDDVLNGIHEMYHNTVRSNLHGCVPTDCCGREKLGYTGDGQLSSYSAMYNYQAYAVYKKWLEDIIGAQNPETGFVPHTAPFYGGGGGPAWGSAIAVIPWNLYLQYGDKEVLRESLPYVRKWISYLGQCRNEAGLVCREEGGSWCLGDWCMPSRYPWSAPHLDEIQVPSELVNTVYYIYCIDIYLKMCSVLGKTFDSGLEEERAHAAQAVNDTYLEECYATGKQGCDIFPLRVGIVPREKEKQVVSHLIESLERNQYCFETGILGTEFLFRVLDRYDRNDVAVKMLTNIGYPSYGYMLQKGATALWETWEGNGARNHEGLSSFDAWLYYGLAGIKPVDSNGGYREFVLKPLFAEELDYLSASVETDYGVVSVEWCRKEEEIIVDINVPFNTCARIDLKGNCFTVNCGSHKYVIK